jgi:hypothetical protein
VIDLHVTPDEYNQLYDAIDQATRTAMLATHWHAGMPDVDTYSVIGRVLGNEVAQAIGFQTARLVVHFDNVVSQRVTEVLE